MAVNLKIFSLGNEVIRIEKKIRFNEVLDETTRDLMLELLVLINEIRLEINKPSKKQYEFKLNLSEDELIKLKNILDNLGIEGEVS